MAAESEPQKKREEIHEYWRNPDETNRTDTYLATGIGRSLFLLSEMRRMASPKDRILEIGCNAGRNLAFLWHGGFKNLQAVEISAPAVENLRHNFPFLNSIKVVAQPVEDFIRATPDDAFDVVFTVAVLEHIHWDSSFVFAEMSRIAKRIVVIEDEETVSERHFPRNYQTIFEGLGMTQVAFSRPVPDLPKSFHYRAFVRRRAAPARAVKHPMLALLGLAPGVIPRDRLLEEKVYLVLNAFFRKGETEVGLPTARDVAKNTGASIEFVQLLQRALVAKGWARGIDNDRISANSESRSLVVAFRNYLRT